MNFSILTDTTFPDTINTIQLYGKIYLVVLLESDQILISILVANLAE